MVIGNDSLNLDKLGVEGLWSSKQIILGYEVDFGKFTIALPGEKAVGAHVLIESPPFGPGSRIAIICDIQELRGNIAHWQGANTIWGFFAEPANRMLSFADITETWIRCSNWDTRRCFWSVIFFLRHLSRYETEWKGLFCGMVEELLPLRKRLSGPRQCLPVLWTTGDAALTRFAAINWRTREFFSEMCRISFLPFGELLKILPLVRTS